MIRLRETIESAAGAARICARFGAASRAWLTATTAALLCLCASAAAAPPLSASHPPEASIGAAAEVLLESGVRLSPHEVLSRLHRGAGVAGGGPVPNFGIGAQPVWLRWRVQNTGTRPIQLRLAIEAPWIDALDVHLLAEQLEVAHWHAGDALPYAERPLAGLGFAFDLDFQPGTTDVLIRAETTDPMVLPVFLMSAAHAEQHAQWGHYYHGLIYGYLLALIAYNLLLYAGLRKRSHLLYAIYLTAFIATNLAYTGHGYAWLWPEHPAFQRYVILVLMVVFGIAGLQFAARFLDLARHAPRGLISVHACSVGGLFAILAAAAAGAQEAAAWIAFGFVVSFALTMLALGGFAVRKHYPAGRYFLAAAVSGMTGTLISTLAVWGFIPYSAWTFHAIEFGMLADATLLALALAHRFRRDQMERLRAEHLARTDPLTGLHNRLAFHELAAPSWSTAIRSERSISVVIFDIDHFKQLNDSHGHARGDQALAAVGQLLLAAARRGDVEARWGGEEFILLLPETDLHQASALAERLRRQIALIRLRAPSGEINFTASFGVATRKHHINLESLIDEADAMLYRAKQQGRDKVVSESEPTLISQAT